MHACTFFFFFDERLVIHLAIHSFVVHNYTTYLPFYLIYMQDMCKMRLWLGTHADTRIDSLTVIFSYPK